MSPVWLRCLRCHPSVTTWPSPPSVYCSAHSGMGALVDMLFLHWLAARLAALEPPLVPLSCISDPSDHLEIEGPLQPPTSLKGLACQLLPVAGGLLELLSCSGHVMHLKMVYPESLWQPQQSQGSRLLRRKTLLSALHPGRDAERLSAEAALPLTPVAVASENCLWLLPRQVCLQGWNHLGRLLMRAADCQHIQKVASRLLCSWVRQYCLQALIARQMQQAGL